MKFYIVHLPELGWNSIVGIFDTSQVTEEELERFFPEGEYAIRESYLSTPDELKLES